MAILAYGLNYRTAPVEVRERIAFPEESLAEALVAIRESVPTLSEAAIVSTCNRTELYAALDPADERLIPAWLASYRRIEPTELASMSSHGLQGVQGGTCGTEKHIWDPNFDV